MGSRLRGILLLPFLFACDGRERDIYHTSMQRISAIATISKEVEMLTWKMQDRVVAGMHLDLWSRPVLHRPRSIAIDRSVPGIQASPCMPQQPLDLRR